MKPISKCSIAELMKMRLQKQYHLASVSYELTTLDDDRVDMADELKIERNKSKIALESITSTLSRKLEASLKQL